MEIEVTKNNIITQLLFLVWEEKIKEKIDYLTRKRSYGTYKSNGGSVEPFLSSLLSSLVSSSREVPQLPVALYYSIERTGGKRR